MKINIHKNCKMMEIKWERRRNTWKSGHSHG
jgi:hypothetical protein